MKKSLDALILFILVIARIRIDTLADLVLPQRHEDVRQLVQGWWPAWSLDLLAHPETDPELRRAVTRVLLALDPEDPAQEAMMASWDPEFRHGFVPATADDYRPIETMLDAVERGCGEGCHR